MTEPAKKRYPIIGFVGLLFLLGGCLNVWSLDLYANPAGWVWIAVIVVGMVVLVYAMMTGNIKLFG